MNSTDSIEKQAAEWIVRREGSNWSGEDQQALDRWLALSMRHKAEFWRLEDGWAEADGLKEAYRLNRESQEDAKSPAIEEARVNPFKPSWHPFSWSVGIAMAASLLLAIATGWLWLSDQHNSTEFAGYSTQVGQRGKLALVDGSSIELNTDTAVRVQETRDHRLMWLDRGEAYFEIAHDPARPFVIHAGSRDVTVLGTKFLVRRDATELTVSVVDGSVRLGGARGTSKVPTTIISRGDVATAQGTSTFIESGALSRIEAALSWREGLLRFDRTRLADAVAEFNRYNQRQILLVGDIGDVRVGGKFQSNNAEGFARSLGRIYPLHVHSSEERVIISLK